MPVFAHPSKIVSTALAVGLSAAAAWSSAVPDARRGEQAALFHGLTARATLVGRPPGAPFGLRPELLAKGKADVWDSGETVGRAQNHVTDLAGGSGAYRFGIVDWPASMRHGYDMDTAARTVINGWAYADFDLISKIAGELGEDADRDALPRAGRGVEGRDQHAASEPGRRLHRRTVGGRRA